MEYPTMEEILTEAGYLPEWLERGRVEGKAEGKAEGREEIARNLKKMGLSITQIAEGTGLPAETIQNL